MQQKNNINFNILIYRDIIPQNNCGKKGKMVNG
jgi:hypothetical protein